MRLAQI